MSIFEQFDVDPAKNNKTPPYGAPEKGLNFDQITDTFRVVMAAIAEIGKIAATSAGAIGSLGKQSASAIQVTGGTMDGVTLTRCIIGGAGANSNTIDPLSIKHASNKIDIGVLPLQVLFNYVHPVGCVRLAVSPTATDWKWPGTSSVWQIVAGSGDHYIVSAGALTGPGQGAGNFPMNKVQPFAGPPDGAGNVVQAYQPGSNQLTGVYQDPVRYGFHIVVRTS